MISIRPLLAVAVAILAALAVLLLDKREKLRDAVSPLAAIAMFAIVASMAPTVLAGGLAVGTVIQLGYCAWIEHRRKCP
ncbi:exported hypothetical protein [Mesorhizobium sp. ORS 3324]|nr:exported hypothetical protein [Mesorhizobium sp. ORS 3324]